MVAVFKHDKWVFVIRVFKLISDLCVIFLCFHHLAVKYLKYKQDLPVQFYLEVAFDNVLWNLKKIPGHKL